MKNKISLQKIICFLLAVALLLVTAGCKDNAPKNKKKKVVKKKVVVVKKDDQEKQDTIIDNTDDDNVSDDATISDSKEEKPFRKIPAVKTTAKTDEYVEVFTPEFESQNVDWAGPSGYTIVYDTDTHENRVLANKLATFFKDNDNVILEVKEDNDQSVVNNGKLILIGDTRIKTSTLGETEFAVTKLENGNVFFEGGHTTMVEKAVDWFRTVKRKDGKLAVLNGTQEDFTSKVNVLGKDYVYVWGDEFDGNELLDDSKWSQRRRNTYSDLTIAMNDPQFQYVENGRLRLSAGRYCDEVDQNIGYACGGSNATANDMIFRNGYLEVKVRFDYGQGSFPAIWFMTNDSVLEQHVPNYDQYKDRYFNLETDIFEFFGEGTHATSNVHKWYNNSQTPLLDKDGNETGYFKVVGVNGVDLTDYYANMEYTKWGNGVFNALIWQYPDIANTFNFSGDAAKNLDKEYHVFQALYTAESVKMGIDGYWYSEWKFDPGVDYKNGVDVTNNNNGIGFNFWHHILLDQYLYTPSRIDEKDESAIVTKDSLPLHSYFDYIRLYQLPDEIAVVTSAMVE